MKLNNKGFTLFTALISLLLVSISLVLIFNMIATEETYLDLIQDQSSMSDLITIADLAKADAFNTFLITLRSTWEEYKSIPSNPLSIDRKQLDQNWTQFVDNFVKEDFFEDNFAGYLATYLYHSIEFKQNPPGYAITVNNKTIATETGSNLQSNRQFNEIIEQIFIDGGQKVEVVDCAQDSDNCVGSFYLTLDTTKISDEDYELLPMVSVLRYKNNQLIQRPILNRQIYKIYMPWRGFQAIRVARRIALGGAEKEDYPAAASNYNGIFNPELHNTLEQARIGFCEPDTCAPRPSFFQTPDMTGFNDKCSNAPTNIPLGNSFVPQSMGIISPGGSYDSKDTTSMETALADLYKLVVKANTPRHSSYGDTGLIMHGDSINDINYMPFKIESEVKQTKTIDEGSASVGSYSQSRFDSLDDVSSKVGGLGLFLGEDNTSQYIWNLNNQWYEQHKNINITVAGSDQESDQPGQTTFSCAELARATINLKFLETNPKYYIKESYNGVPVQINIQLIDSYTQFYFPNSRIFWQGLTATNNGYIQGTPPDLEEADVEEDFRDHWACYSEVSGDGSECGIQ